MIFYEFIKNEIKIFSKFPHIELFEKLPVNDFSYYTNLQKFGEFIKNSGEGIKAPRPFKYHLLLNAKNLLKNLLKEF
jgi:hypothetical protein